MPLVPIVLKTAAVIISAVALWSLVVRDRPTPAKEAPYFTEKDEEKKKDEHPRDGDGDRDGEKDGKYDDLLDETAHRPPRGCPRCGDSDRPEASGNRFSDGGAAAKLRRADGCGCQWTQQHEGKGQEHTVPPPSTSHAQTLKEMYPSVDLTVCQHILEDFGGDLQRSVDYMLTEFEEVKEATGDRDTTEDGRRPSGDSTDTFSDAAAAIPLNKEEVLCELSHVSALQQEVERRKAALAAEKAAVTLEVQQLTSLEETRDLIKLLEAHGGDVGEGADAKPAADDVTGAPTVVSAIDSVVNGGQSTRSPSACSFDDISRDQGNENTHAMDIPTVGSQNDVDHLSESSWSDVGTADGTVDAKSP